MSTSSTGEFGRMRSFFWPIHGSELKRFLPLFIIYALICFNYSLLRATKDTQIITAPASGAEAIVFIKVWVILPMALFATFLFTRLVNKHSQEKVFYIMMTLFLSFFILFATVLYPYRDVLHPHAFCDDLQASLPMGFKGLISILRNWTFTLFYVMSELWSTMIMTVLFWGFANQITPVKDAKRFYAILGVGANLATILSGQVTYLFSVSTLGLGSLIGNDAWGQSLSLITAVLVLSGLATMALFRWYCINVVKKDVSINVGKSKNKMGLKENFAYLAKSKYLICIAVVVITYNLAVNMIEIVWKDQVKMLFPNPTDYNAYMGKVMTVMGFLSTFIGLFVCSNILRRFGWTIGALITPLIILVTGVFFFTFILFKDSALAGLIIGMGMTPLALSVFFGSMQNSLTRACKYTLFDSTKEISFIPLSDECKLKGKAAIDGVGSRLGKSGGSLFHQGLLMIFGSVSLSTPYVGVFLLLVVGSYILAVKALGKQFTSLTEHNEKIDIDEAEPVKLKEKQALV